MLFWKLLSDDQRIALDSDDLWELCSVPVQAVWAWVRMHVHTTLCWFKHERSLLTPGDYFSNCLIKKLNRACGHTYNLVTLMFILQQIISELLEREIEQVKIECGNLDIAHNRAALSDQNWWPTLHGLRNQAHSWLPTEYVREPGALLLQLIRDEQRENADYWEDVIRATLAGFEEVVIRLSIDATLQVQR